MSYTLLISTDELAANLADPGSVIVDCRFALDDTEKGRREYVEAHIPGAVYAHLDKDLSGPIGDGSLGRHPLPSVESCVERFSAMGIDAGHTGHCLRQHERRDRRPALVDVAPAGPRQCCGARRRLAAIGRKKIARPAPALSRTARSVL